MKRLTVLYDARCGLCARAHTWLERQERLLELEFVPAASAAARARFPTLEHPDPPEDLVVVDDEGGVYRNDDAWIMTLYALEQYRSWALRLAAPALRPLARAAFEWLSRNRRSLSRRLALAADADVALALAQTPASCPRPIPPPSAARARR
jgi:predicted DCC family thiol-disulfide oxidoreductase YuxK